MKWKKLTLCLAVPLAVGGLSWALTRQGIETFQNQTVHPFLTPPQWAFPVVWTALFLMLGLASFLVWDSQEQGRRVGGALPALTDETSLSVETPYDELYRHYVEAQIHYCNGEMARYNSAAACWNNAFVTYRDYVCRTAAARGGVRALKLC